MSYVRSGLSRRLLAASCCAVAILFAQLAGAGVLQTGNVVPTDDPFTIDDFEGLPPAGNDINPFEGESANEQTEFEFLIPDGAGELIVGETSFGAVQIDGGSAIRSETLVIGASGERDGMTRFGTGVMRITGFGSLYNNDPSILPYGLDPETFGTIRAGEDGYDLFVGADGNGTLEISFGGRAEIQDSVVVGDLGSAVGSLIVTGADSFLGSGGFSTGGPADDSHAMSIGRLGTGQLQITAGGLVYTLGTDSDASDAIIAAVVGGNPYDGSQAPESGGQGTVLVDGIGSKWIVGGTLQLGGFHNSSTGIGGGEDQAGILAFYGSTVGRGTLTVSNGGIVDVLLPSDGEQSDVDELDLVIGRFGRVDLDGGRIEVLGGFESGEDPDPLVDNVRVINDGVISGHGYISTGRFQNRALGEVRVGAGQKLVVDAVGQVSTSGGVEQLPLVNFGLMQVFGNETGRAELEFDRAPNSPDAPVEPFINQRLSSSLTIDNGGRRFGLIHAQDANLRFRSGLLNQGQMSFTAGDNVVSGDVFNLPADIDGEIGDGVITISGDSTTVVFEDDLFNDGTIDIAPNASLMTVLGNYVQGPTGILQMTLGGGESGSELSYLQVGDDAILGGTLEVSLFASGANPIMPMAGDSYEIMSAAGDLIGVFANQIMPDLGPDLDIFPVYDPLADTVTLVVASLLNVIGADFNGDGIVNRADLDIWSMNFGVTMSASPAQGDADGDGDVDGHDLLLWQQQVGGPGMGSGIGSGAGSSAGAVPEPTSVALLLTGGLLALACRRRR